MALVTKYGIRVVSYVHTDQGLVEFDDLTPEQKQKAATELKLRYMNDLYRGKAVFTAEEA